MHLKIGILALQGDVEEHANAFQDLNITPCTVKIKEDFTPLDGLVIPGGESTTLNRLISRYNLKETLQQLKNQQLPTLGTCAGLILMAREILSELPGFSYNLIDMLVSRNAYGRQRESFEAPVSWKLNGKGKTIPGVFIRAPKILEVGKGVKVLATLEDEPVIVQEDNFLACSFHPELTSDRTIHKYFIELVQDYKKCCGIKGSR